MALRAPLLRLALLTLPALVLACGNNSQGDDYAVTVSWLINGAAPTRALCGAYGVDKVRFTLLTSSTSYIIDTPCEEGIVFDDGEERGGFVSSVSFDFGVRYRYDLQMLDARGRPIPGLSDSSSFQAFYGDATPYELSILELYSPEGDTAVLSGSWTAGTDLAQGCAARGIDDVAIEVASFTDDQFTQAVEAIDVPCTAGMVVSSGPILAEGHYYLRYVAYRGNTVVTASEPIEFIVDQPGEVALDPVAF